MKIWEFKNGSLNDVAMLVYAEQADIDADIFDAKGLPLQWATRPKAVVFVEPRRKKPKPRVDISALRPGALVLNGRAKAKLEDLLSQFGQLLEIDVEGAPEWFYNVTNLVDCIDVDRSEKRPSGAISREVFDEAKLPLEPALFKDPRTARTKIYANDAAKTALEALLAEAGITGAAFAEPGASARSPRSAA